MRHPAPRIGQRLVAALAASLAMAGCASGPYATSPSSAPESARSDDVFAAIPRAATMDQVRERLGPPDQSMAFPVTHTVAWSYFYYDTWGFYCEEAITFDAGGRIVDKFSKRIGYGGASGRQ